MNTEYLIWFALLVAVTGAVLVWLAIGDLPEIPADPGMDSEAAGEDSVACSA